MVSNPYMPFGEKRRVLVQAGLLAALLGGFAWLVLRPHEPMFEGKPVSFWIFQAYHEGTYENGSAQPQAESALRSLGTNAVPLLLKMVSTRRTLPRLIVGSMADDRSMHFFHLPQQEGKHEMAVWGFRLLGRKARPAIPALMALLDDPDPWVRAHAAKSLVAIGPTLEAVPALIKAFQRPPAKLTRFNKFSWSGWGEAMARDVVVQTLGEVGPGASAAIPYLEAETNHLAAQLTLLRIKGESLAPFMDQLKSTADQNRWTRVAMLVGQLGTNAEPAIPLLVSALGSTNQYVRQEAIRALGAIHQRPELSVPALITMVRSKEGNDQVNAIVALRRFGPAAKPAVPALLERLDDPDEWTLRQLTNTLREADREAAARAGIK